MIETLSKDLTTLFSGISKSVAEWIRKEEIDSLSINTFHLHSGRPPHIWTNLELQEIITRYTNLLLAYLNSSPNNQ